jgi:hypothetical protein
MKPSDKVEVEEGGEPQKEGKEEVKRVDMLLQIWKRHPSAIRFRAMLMLQ